MSIPSATAGSKEDLHLLATEELVQEHMQLAAVSLHCCLCMLMPDPLPAPTRQPLTTSQSRERLRLFFCSSPSTNPPPQKPTIDASLPLPPIPSSSTASTQLMRPSGCPLCVLFSCLALSPSSTPRSRRSTGLLWVKMGGDNKHGLEPQPKK